MVYVQHIGSHNCANIWNGNTKRCTQFVALYFSWQCLTKALFDNGEFRDSWILEMCLKVNAEAVFPDNVIIALN